MAQRGGLTVRVTLGVMFPKGSCGGMQIRHTHTHWHVGKQSTIIKRQLIEAKAMIAGKH